MPGKELDEAVELAGSDSVQAGTKLLSAIDREIGNLRRQVKKMTNRQSAREGHTRENIEKLIRESAGWGYQAGTLGAPPIVPDVEWNDDGTWRITTEAPKNSREVTPSVEDYEDRKSRQIRQLEEEIKKVERERRGKFGIVGLGDEKWLRDLKDKLSRIDPGNIWASR